MNVITVSDKNTQKILVVRTETDSHQNQDKWVGRC